MKVKIEKKSQHHPIKVELTYDTSKAPLTMEVSNVELRGLLTVLETATKADKVVFTLEI